MAEQPDAGASDSGPMVSVVLPARNEELLIGAALASIGAQTFPLERVEAIVVENDSTDATAEMATAAARSLPALSVRVLHEDPPGVARAKNIGARAAQGRLVLFMDADSRMSPNLLSVVAARAVRGERAASIRVIADSHDALDRGFFWLMEWGKRLFGIRANMSWMERTLFEQLGGFDERLQQAEDLDLMVRARRQGVAVGHVAEASIATSPRRLRAGPLRLGTFRVFGRWALGNFGIGRRWPY